MVANVFISYRSADRNKVQQIADALRAAGHDVWIDVEKIEIGDSIIGRINEGLAGANYVVLCYSANDVSTPYMTREWYSALARQLDRHDVRLLPVRLTGGTPPVLLADIKYADLTTDWNKGIASLLKAIR